MKEPSLYRRRRPNSVKKLKLVCSFNGAFQPRPPSGKLRYIGGETRIVSVDRNITLSKLKSKVSELCPNNPSFSLKYQLPGSEPLHVSTTITPLVLIASDDDVRCMIDMYDKLESYGKPSRLWVFVCNDKGYVRGNTDLSVDLNTRIGVLCRDNGFDVDRRVNCVKSVSGFGDSTCVNAFETLNSMTRLSKVQVNAKETKNSASNVVSGVRYSDDSLRKMVLKQLLAKQSPRVHGVCEFSGLAVPETEIPSGYCSERQKYDNPLVDLASEPPVLPMSHTITNHSLEEPYRTSRWDYKIPSTHLPGSQNFGNLVPVPVLHSHPLNPRDGNLCMETTRSVQCFLGQSGHVSGNGAGINGGSSGQFAVAEQFSKQPNNSCMIAMSTAYNAKRDLRNFEQASLGNFNRENIMPWAANCDAVEARLAPLSCSSQLVGSAYTLKSSYTGNRVWGGLQSSIRNHRFGVSDTRNQQTCSYDTRNYQSNLTEMGNHRTVRLDGRPLEGKCYPGLKPSSNISKHGQSMGLYYPNSWKAWSGSHDHTMEGMVGMMDPSLNNQTSSFDLQYGKENLREQGGLAVSQYGKPNHKECHLAYRVAQAGMGEKCEVPYPALSESVQGVPVYCRHICCDLETEKVVDFSGCPNSPGYRNGTEFGCKSKLSNMESGIKSLSNHHNGSHTLQGGIASSVDLSLHNASLSSSKEVEPPALSSLASSDVSEALLKTQSKPLDLIDVGFSSGPQVEISNGVASNSSSQSAVKSGKDCGHKEEMQQDSPSSLSINGKADLKEPHKCSKVFGGISSDLAAFYTHLATRELQTIKNSDLEHIKELGSGTYGTVFHGKWKGSDVAIKRIKTSCFTGGALEEDRLVADLWKEAYMLGQLHHPNIVAFYGVVTDGPVTNLATVTEYMVNGSLKQVLQKKDRTIDRRKRIIIAMDAAFGMEYLHEKNIVHFDLKSHNFLVNMRDPQRPVCKIGDLGLSKIKQKTLVSGGVRGTIPWMAPELLNSKNNLVTEKVDVYSFGVVMWELLTGEEPYANLRSEEIIAGIIKGNLRPEIPSWCDPTWRSLMERCWSSDPDSRPAFSEIAKELRAMSAAMSIK